MTFSFSAKMMRLNKPSARSWVKHFDVTLDLGLEWFLGIHFRWKHDEDGKTIKCHLLQEAFIQDLLACTQLIGYNTSPLATPFWQGLPVDTITNSINLVELPLYSTQKTEYYQEIMGQLHSKVTSMHHSMLSATLPQLWIMAYLILMRLTLTLTSFSTTLYRKTFPLDSWIVTGDQWMLQNLVQILCQSSAIQTPIDQCLAHSAYTVMVPSPGGYTATNTHCPELLRS